MLLCALGGSPVGAQSASPPSNGDCLGCHEDPALTRGDGSALTVAPQPFEASVHGSFACVDCHLDLATVTEFPHAEKLQRVDCGVCHDASMQFSASVHVRRPRGRGDVAQALTCASCHGSPHAIRSSTELASPTHKVNTARTCGMCHGDQPAPPGMAGPAVASMFADSIHGQARSGDGAMAPTCTDCHASHGVLEKTSPESPVFRTNVPATCGTCHTATLQEFHDSVHAAALARGDTRAPHCASCHTAHAVRATTSEDWQLEAVQQCGTCHREALATYRDTFHGQVTRLGFAAVAKCADCHRSHGIRSAADAASTVAPGNLISTCGQCHRDANANFVKYQPHANQHDRDRLPQLYYAGRFMDTLLLGVFVFFGAHTTLWFLRERRGPPDPDEPAPDA
jgi:hypothetical protein